MSGECAISSVFIAEPEGSGWIIRHLMLDVAAELERRGIPVRIGAGREYRGEEILLNARYLTPVDDSRARVNSLFITHVDDALREAELRRILPRFNSLVCMSSHDAEFVAALKGSNQGVIGIDLPPRSVAVKPVRLAFFSARYADGRKNENWIVDYFRLRPPEYRLSFIFSFLGGDWEPFADELAALDLNYELHRYRRDLPGEYDLYRTALSRNDALIYLGFDGGAMSVYDALECGLDVIATDASYHRGLGDAVELVQDRGGFFEVLDRLHTRVRSRADALGDRVIDRYVDRLLDHWQSALHSDAPVPTMPAERAVELKNEFRSHYKRIGLSRLRSAAIRLLQRRRWSTRS